MMDDPRCCGSGTCIIDKEGRCWCGQQWNGETMGFAGPGLQPVPPLVEPQAEDKGNER